MGDKTSGRRTNHPAQAHTWGDNGRQWQTRGDMVVGRRTHTIRRETGGEKGGQTLRRRTHHQQKHTCGETMGRRTHHPTKGNKKGYNGRQDPREGGHTIQARETRREGRRTIQQRKQEGVQWETRGEQDPRECGRTIQHQGRHLRKALRTPNSTLLGEIYPHQMVGCISPL